VHIAKITQTSIQKEKNKAVLDFDTVLIEVRLSKSNTLVIICSSLSEFEGLLWSRTCKKSYIIKDYKT